MNKFIKPFIKKELTDFEIKIIIFLRKKRVRKMEHPGNIIIHYDKDVNPVGVEKRLIYK